MIKNYLLDTNILLQNPQSLFGFEDNNVYLCGTTMQELDSKKTAPGELGYNARECCRILDGLRETGDLTKGVVLHTAAEPKKCGKLYVEPDGVDQGLLPKGFKIDVPDNRIISTCLYLNQEKLHEKPIVLVTNDISMRVNASICGLHVEGYRNDQIAETDYTGQTDITVSSSLIDRLYAEKSIPFTPEEYGLPGIYENHFITLHGGENQSALTIHKDGKLFLLPPQSPLFGGIRPLNAMQRYALYALLAPAEEIPLVVLVGPAGTAKPSSPWQPDYPRPISDRDAGTGNTGRS